MESPRSPELRAAIEELERKWNEFFHLSDKGGPETLYHYTSADGLRGILSRRVLWASSVLRMTDSSEVVYGRQVVADVL